MKKLLILLCTLLLAVSAFGLAGCKPKEEEKTTLKPAPADFSYYPKLPAAKDKKLYVIKGSAIPSKAEPAVYCLQGLVARESSEIYVLADDNQGDVSNYKLWLDDLTENYGYTVEYVDSVADLMQKYKSYVTEGGIVVYDEAESTGDDGLNVATTVCAAEGFLPVERTLLESAQSDWGLGEVKIDVAETTEDGDYRDCAWAFATYKDRLTSKILIHQDPQKHTLRDYAVAAKAFTFFKDRLTDIRFVTDVYQWADKDIPIMGWCEDELEYVALNSGFSKITIGADWSQNLTTFSSVNMPSALKQNNYTQRTVTPDSGKHYLALVMSDGDNIQWMQNSFALNDQYFGSGFRGDFKLTWGANPSASDLIPSVLQKVYNMATENDEFITGVSGNGYINPTSYASLNDYASRTNAYMKRADLKYVDLLDPGADPAAIQPYGQMPDIGGGVWKVGNKYVEGGGAVYWANGKPFITFRESLWGETSQSMLEMANRINHYQTDPNRIEGYTVLNIHPWTHSMTDVKRFVSMLDEHVELVTAGELIEMVKANVPHNDVEKLEKVDIPPVEQPDYVLPGLTEEDLALIGVQSANEFDTEAIAKDFSVMGKYDKHGEGMCLEVQTPGDDMQSYLYAKFAITAANDKLTVSARRFVRPQDRDGLMTVRVVGADGKCKTIRADGEEEDWLVIDTDPYKTPSYTLTEYIGQTVVIAIGSKAGEHTAINNIRLYPAAETYVFPTVSLSALKALTVSDSYSFDTDTIFDKWQKVALAGYPISKHGEGTCLEFAGQNADVDSPMNTFLWNRFAVDGTHNRLTISARTFTGQNNPVQGANPQYIPQLYVVVATEAGETFTFPLVPIDKDEYIVSHFDLSNYVGQTVGIAVGSGRGYHCVINAISFSESVENKVVLPGIKLKELNVLPVADTYSFDTETLYSDWHKPVLNGDSVIDKHGEGTCLQFAGENAPLDAPMNVFIYRRFAITEAHCKLTVSARTFAGQNNGYDPQLYVVVVTEDGEVKTFPLVAVDSDNYVVKGYDLSDYIGKNVTVALGIGRGYHCCINSVTLTEAGKEVLPGVTLTKLNAMEASATYLFEHNATTKNILTDWKKVGQVNDYGEGASLDYAGQNADVNAPMNTFLYNRFAIDAAHSKLTVSARTFVGQNNPVANADPQYIPQLYVVVVTEEGETFTFPLVAIDTDEYVVADFDLTDYVGQTVGIAIGIGRGYHCAINRISIGA